MSRHYTLRVSSAEVAELWRKRPLTARLSRRPSLYAEISVADVVRRTVVINDTKVPVWEEDFPLSCPSDTVTLYIKIKHDSAKDICIGRGESRLRWLLREGDEVELPLHISENPESDVLGFAYLELQESDAKTNAQLAIKNLIRDIRVSKLESISDSIEDLTGGRNDILSSDLLSSLQDSIPTVDAIVKSIDSIAETHPYLKLVWNLTTVLYRIVSSQINFDKRLRDLVEDLAKTFRFVDDATSLNHLIDSFALIIDELLDFITECSLFIRAYVQHAFIDRTLRVNEKEKIEDFESKLAKLRDDFKIGVVLQTANAVDFHSGRKILEKLEHQLKPVRSSGATHRECLEGTGIALRKTINCWAEGTDLPNILLLMGGAGTGKSTIATTIAEEYRRKDRLGSHFLCLKGMSDPTTVIRTFAYNLAVYNQQIAQNIASELRGVELDSSTPKGQFNILLSASLGKAARKDGIDYPVLIILDALDECGTVDTRKQLVRLLEYELSTLPPNFRILITSRPEEDIVSLLPSQSHVHSIMIDQRSEDNKQDVLMFIKFEFEHLRKSGRLRVPADWPWEDSLEALGEAADGLFIWASTAIKYISEKKSDRFTYFKKLVEDASVINLDDLYVTVLEESLDWDDFTREIFPEVFSLIFFSKVPLSDKDIDGILYLKEGSTANLLLCLQSLVAYEPGQPIHVHHASLFDYLTSPSNKEEYWFIDIKYRKQQIVSRCIDLMGRLLKFNICKLESSFLLNEDVYDLNERIRDNIPTFLQYACHNWAQHLKEVPHSDELHKRLKAFVYSRLLGWFEVLSLTGVFKSCVGSSLIYAMTWIRSKDKPLYTFLQDAYRQASEFCDAISQSTPHIYVSLLALTRDDSRVSNFYAKCMKSLVKVDYIGARRRVACIKEIQCNSGDVTCVTFSRDGTSIISGTWGDAIRIWCSMSGDTIGEPLGDDPGGINSISLSLDGKYVVSGSSFGNIQIWDTVTGEKIRDLGFAEGQEVYAVAFSSGGKYVAYGSSNNTICILDFKTGNKVKEFEDAHSDNIRSITYSRSGRHIVSGSDDSTICVWDTRSGELLYEPIRGHLGPIYSVSFSPDGKRIVSGSGDGSVRIWNTEDGESVCQPLKDNCGAVYSVVFTPSGSFLLSGSEDGIVRLWDTAKSLSPARRFDGHTGKIWTVSFSSDGSRFLSGSSDGSIRMWDIRGAGTATNQPLNAHSDGISSITVSPDGSSIASGSFDGQVCLWNVSNISLISGSFSGHTDTVCSVAYSPRGESFVSTSQDGTMCIWSPRGDCLISRKSPGRASSIAFSPDGKFIASGSEDGSISIWDFSKKIIVSGPFQVQERAILSVAYSPDGKYVASGSYDGTVCVWDIEYKEYLVGPLRGHSNIVNSVAYSPDGYYIASASDDETIRIWDVNNGEIICEPITGHSRVVSSVSFSPDGGSIVSGSWDRTVCIWDAYDGSLLYGPFEGHSDRISSVCFFPDGKRVASGSWDKTIQIWTLDENQMEDDWDLREDGWIVSPSNEHLIWIPTELRRTLCRRNLTAILNIPFNTIVDFQDSSLGERWARCSARNIKYVVEE